MVFGYEASHHMKCVCAISEAMRPRPQRPTPFMCSPVMGVWNSLRRHAAEEARQAALAAVEGVWESLSDASVPALDRIPPYGQREDARSVDDVEACTAKGERDIIAA
jgi:hypothetical protein